MGIYSYRYFSDYLFQFEMAFPEIISWGEGGWNILHLNLKGCWCYQKIVFIDKENNEPILKIQSGMKFISGTIIVFIWIRSVKCFVLKI